MDNNLIIEEKFKYIVDNTIAECNRVLDVWARNSQKVSYNQQESLFKNYLSKFFRDKYSPILYNKYIRRCDFSVIIKENTIFKVSIGGFNSDNSYLHGIITQLNILNKNASIVLPYNTNVYNKQENINDVKIESLIDYNKIINIKF